MQDWYWYTLISYCVRNGAYIGCDPPDVGLSVPQHSHSDDNKSAADCIVDTVNPDSSQDLTACSNAPVCGDNDSVTSFQMNGFVDDLSADRLQSATSPVSQQSDSEPCSDRSTGTVSGSRLSNSITESADCNGVEADESIVESRDVGQSCPLLLANNALAECCNFSDSILPPVNTLPADLPPTAELHSLPDASVQESALDIRSAKQLDCKTIADGNRDANPTCLTVMTANYEFDPTSQPADLSAEAYADWLTDALMQRFGPGTNAVERLQCEVDTDEVHGASCTCQSVPAESSELDSVPPQAGTISANPLPSAGMHSLADGCMTQYAAGINAVEQLDCATNAAEAHDANPACQILVASTLMVESSQLDGIPLPASLPPTAEQRSLPGVSQQESVPGVSVVKQLHHETNGIENQDANHTRQSVGKTLISESCELSAVPPPLRTVSANLPAAAELHSLPDTSVQESLRDIGADDQLNCRTDAVKSVARHAGVDSSSAQSSPRSVDRPCDFSTGHGSEAELSVMSHSVNSDVLHGAVDSGPEVAAAVTTNGNYPSDLSQTTAQILSAVKSVRKSFAEYGDSGLNGEAAGTRRNVSVCTPRNSQSLSSGQFSALPVSSGRWSGQRRDERNISRACPDNSTAASNVPAEDTANSSPSPAGNAAAHYKTRSPVVTGQPAVDKRVPTTSVELQQKIIRQMEVCVHFVVLLFVLNIFRYESCSISVIV